MMRCSFFCRKIYQTIHHKGNCGVKEKRDEWVFDCQGNQWSSVRLEGK